MLAEIEYLLKVLNEMSVSGIACLAMLTAILSLVVVLKALKLKKGD